MRSLTLWSITLLSHHSLALHSRSRQTCSMQTCRTSSVRRKKLETSQQAASVGDLHRKPDYREVARAQLFRDSLDSCWRRLQYLQYLQRGARHVRFLRKTRAGVGVVEIVVRKCGHHFRIVKNFFFFFWLSSMGGCFGEGPQQRNSFFNMRDPPK